MGIIRQQKTVTYSLRPATKQDIPFMFRLRYLTMKPFFESTHGWNDTEEFEKAADELNNAKIVIAEKEKAGIIKVIPKPCELHLHQIQLLPEFQKKGIGTELLKKTIEQSENLQLPLSLFVITHSPAKLLYDRLGFVITEEHKHHCRMCRQPATPLK
jgi:ribosomal protein S18 acetylase RimI-like enzyme